MPRRLPTGRPCLFSLSPCAHRHDRAESGRSVCTTLLFTARHNVCVSDRLTEYCVDRDLVDHEEAERACHAVIDAVLPRVETAWMDAYSDEKDLPIAAVTRRSRSFEWGAPGQRETRGWVSILMFGEPTI